MALKDISRHYADVLALGGALPAVRVPIGEARGLVLAEDAARALRNPTLHELGDGRLCCAPRGRDGGRAADSCG